MQILFLRLSLHYSGTYEDEQFESPPQNEAKTPPHPHPHPTEVVTAALLPGLFWLQ